MTDRAQDLLPGSSAPLRASTTADDEFLAGVCHRVRTPLNGILGSLELLLDAEISDEVRVLAAAAFQSAHDLHRVFETEVDAALQAG